MLVGTKEMYTCSLITYGSKTFCVLFGNLIALRFDALPYFIIYKLLILEAIIINILPWIF